MQKHISNSRCEARYYSQLQVWPRLAFRTTPTSDSYEEDEACQRTTTTNYNEYVCARWENLILIYFKTILEFLFVYFFLILVHKVLQFCLIYHVGENKGQGYFKLGHSCKFYCWRENSALYCIITFARDLQSWLRTYFTIRRE